MLNRILLDTSDPDFASAFSSKIAGESFETLFFSINDEGFPVYTNDLALVEIDVYDKLFYQRISRLKDKGVSIFILVSKLNKNNQMRASEAGADLVFTKDSLLKNFKEIINFISHD